MRAKKDLAAVGDNIMLEVSDDAYGYLVAQMLAGGAGTVVIEGTMADDPVAAADWIALNVKAAGTDVGAANIAAPGIVYAFNPGYNKVRARKTVGVASCPVIFGSSQTAPVAS